METVIKTELIRRISKKINRRFTQEEIELVLNAALDSMIDVIEEGNRLSLREYFTIIPKHDLERPGRNVVENTTCIIPERYRPKLNFGKRFIEACERLTEKEL